MDRCVDACPEWGSTGTADPLFQGSDGAAPELSIGLWTTTSCGLASKKPQDVVPELVDRFGAGTVQTTQVADASGGSRLPLKLPPPLSDRPR